MGYVLIIDDHRNTADSLALMLKLLGHEAQVGLGPLPAVPVLLRRPPDFILLDIHMHGMDGIEVCRYIRREPRLARVPIVAMSSDTQPELIERVRQVGANGFLAKPITIEALEELLEQIQRRAGDAAAGADAAQGA